jgi:uncharacterized membrane protein YgcG
MKQKGFILAAWLGLFIIVSGSAFSSSNYKLVNGQKDFYYGHVSYADIKNDGQDPVVLREGRLVPETAVLNLPLGPGDVIQTSAERRLEVQFDNGTIIRLDLDTRLKIETLMAQSLSTAKKISNFVLQKGHVYVMYKEYKSLELFQVVTPGAAVKLDHNTVALIRLTDKGDTAVQVERGKAFLLYGVDKLHLSQKRINAKQRAIVSVEDQFELADFEVLSDFKAWNESLNANFQELHEGSYLPKPIRTVTKAVFEFAQKFGNMYGEWLWHDLYGYVWRPYLNDQRYPWGSWAPYLNGSWTSYNGEMFWVPSEAWGWVPYHLGIWMWDKSKGWVWLPGSMFAPAWAVWEFYSGMYCWRPYYLYDWMYGFDGFWGPLYWGWPSGNYGYYASNPRNSQPSQDVRDSIRKDQLKKKNRPSLPMPNDMKKSFKTTLAALKRGDHASWSAVEGVVRHSVFITKQDFLSARWQEKVVPFDRLAKEIEAAPEVAKPAPPSRSAAVARDARLTIERSHVIADIRAQLLPSLKTPGENAPVLRDIEFSRRQMPGRPEAAAPPSFRFRDWNPDIKTAIRLGVEISYLSRSNEIACPQFGLTSRDINPAMLTNGTLGGYTSSGGSLSSSGSSSEGGSTSQSTGQSQSSGSSGSPKHKN